MEAVHDPYQSDHTFSGELAMSGETDDHGECEACDNINVRTRTFDLCDACYNAAGAQHAAVRQRLSGERPTNWQDIKNLYDENGVRVARIVRVTVEHLGEEAPWVKQDPLYSHPHDTKVTIEAVSV